MTKVRTFGMTSVLSASLLTIVLITVCGSVGCTPPEDNSASADSQQVTPGSASDGANSNKQDGGAAGDDGAPADETKAGEDSGPAAEPQPDPTPYMLSAEELADGWIALFDGVSLFGWTQEKGKANWRVEDGVIVVDGGEEGFLVTNSAFDNYVLKVDFRAAEKTNSGVFLHMPRVPTDPAKDCYELNIAPADNPFPTGSLVQRKKVEGDYTGDKWQTYEVRVMGDSVAVLLDGKQILDYTDEHPLWRGYIGLQHREGKVQFRNVKLKPLELKPLLGNAEDGNSENAKAGEEVAGWSKHGDSQFTVSEAGELHVKGGKGWLESDGFFKDFTLQFECRTNAPGLNSGLFFRCIEGEEMNGYECQIHNGFKNGDRTQPVDAGTGAIFRRTVARRVVADDNQWFYTTIVAEGPHFAVWVNGYQVTDWTDDRQPDLNPRRGLRLEAGKLMIQGHDKTTDVSFRKLRAREIAEREER